MPRTPRAGKPKTARLFLAGMDGFYWGRWVDKPIEAVLDEFSNFNVLVLNNRIHTIEKKYSTITNLLTRNPQQKIFAFYSWCNIPLWARTSNETNLWEVRFARFLDWANMWLPRVGGTRGSEPEISAWPECAMQNVTDPRIAEEWARSVAAHFLEVREGVGYPIHLFIDVTWDEYGWIESVLEQKTNGWKFDADRDGKPDNHAWFDQQASSCLYMALTILRETLEIAGVKDAIIIGNGGCRMTSVQNGRMWEDFDERARVKDYWQEVIGNRVGRVAGAGHHVTAPGSVNILNVRPGNLEFGLATSLLRDDLHFYVSDAAETHSSRIVDPRFDTIIGSPIDSAIQTTDGVWTRQYQNVIVVADFNTMTGTFTVK